MKKLVLSVILVIVLAGAFATVAKSAEQIEKAETVAYRKSCEETFLAESRALLTEMGYENCGVTLNRVGLEEGSWEYTLQIHHKRILKADSDKQEKIAARLKETEILKGCGTVEISFF